MHQREKKHSHGRKTSKYLNLNEHYPIVLKKNEKVERDKCVKGFYHLTMMCKFKYFSLKLSKKCDYISLFYLFSFSLFRFVQIINILHLEKMK